MVKWSVVYYIIQLQFNYIKLTYNKLCTLLICTNVCVYVCVCVCVCVCDKYIVATYTCTCSGLHFVCEYVVLYIQMYMYILLQHAIHYYSRTECRCISDLPCDQDNPMLLVGNSL